MQPEFRDFCLGFRVALARKLEGVYSVENALLPEPNSIQRVNQQRERRDDGLDALLRDLDTVKRAAPSRMPVEAPQRIYTYEARLIPYVLEGGTKKYVPAEVNSDITSGMFVRRDMRGGKYEVVLGTNSLSDGLLRLGLTYGRYSAKEWISSQMFNGQAKEVQLK